MSKLKSVNQAENTEKENDIIEMGEKLQDTLFAQETWIKEENIIKEKVNSLLRDIEEEKINSEIELKKMKDQQEDIQEKEKILLEELQSLNQELKKKDNLINELEIKLDLESRVKLDEISKIRVELQEKEKMFEDCKQELDKLQEEGYLETSLMDINPPELNEPILQPGVRSMDMKNPEIIRTRIDQTFGYLMV